MKFFIMMNLFCFMLSFSAQAEVPIGVNDKDPDFSVLQECGAAFPGQGDCKKGDEKHYTHKNKTNDIWDRPQRNSKFKPGIRQPSGISKPQKSFNAR